MSGRGLSKAFRCRDCAFRSAAPIQLRTFATSPVYQKHGTVPSFSETSSPELDGILTTFREKIFLPAHLSKQQRDLIYGAKHTRMLNVEPVVAEVGNDKFRLLTIDRTKDVPDTIKSLYAAIDLMQDKRDWDNLPSLLQGLKNSGRKLRDYDHNMITRKAAKAGRQDVILECARRVSDTGFVLSRPALVAEFMWWIQHKALSSNWGSKETKQALMWAEMVSVMLEDSRHAGNRVIAGGNDPRVQPEMIGILLELAAVRAARHLKGKDEGGKVAEYAARLLGLDFDIKFPRSESGESITSYDANRYLRAAVPVLYGMKVAQTVLDPASKEVVALKAKAADLETEVFAQREKLESAGWMEGQYPLGMWIHDQLLGAKTS